MTQSLSLLLPILPAGILLIFATKLHWLEFLNHPIDGGLSFRGKPILGSNKTWRGLAIYLSVGTASVWLLHLAASPWLAPIFRNEPIALGVCWSGAYVLGELINSFLKRRLAIGSGEAAHTRLGALAQRFFDNVDGSLASGAVLLFGYWVEWQLLLAAFVFGYLAHLATDALMRRLRLKHKQ